MIYILLPAYNEEENIEAVLKEISAVLKDNKEEFKVIVVNDGSTDSTAEILNQCSSWIPLEVINFEKNKGVGEVFRRGITDICRQAQGDDILISLDCDRTHPAKIFPKLIMALRNGDEIVIASRYHPESKTENLPLLRLMLSDGINLMLRFFYPIKQVKDYTTFFRAYKVSLLKKALAAYGGVLMEQKGFSSMAEMLIRISRCTKKMSEVAVELRFGKRKGKSKMRIFRTILEYLGLIFKNFRQKRK